MNELAPKGIIGMTLNMIPYPALYNLNQGEYGSHYSIAKSGYYLFKLQPIVENNQN